MEGRSGNNFGSALSEDSVILALFIDFTRDPRNFNAGFCTHIAGRCSACMLVWVPGERELVVRCSDLGGHVFWPRRSCVLTSAVMCFDTGGHVF